LIDRTTPMSEKHETSQVRSWWQRFVRRFRGSLQPEGTLAAPTGQHYQENAEARFYREHGYARATAPLPWGEDITAHNGEVEREYREEVARRQAAYEIGAYVPRYFCESLDTPGVFDRVNWDLEMSLLPGRRVNLTDSPGVPMQPVLTSAEHRQAREVGHLGRVVSGLERQRTIRDEIGSREDILAFVGGNADIADQVEDKARELFGVEDLDAPLLLTGPREMTPAERAFDTAVKGLHTDDGYYLKDPTGKIVGIID
jgi:hypothetical protein